MGCNVYFWVCLAVPDSLGTCTYNIHLYTCVGDKSVMFDVGQVFPLLWYACCCISLNLPCVHHMFFFLTCTCRTAFSNSLSTRITFANQIVYMIAGLAKKQVSSIAPLKGGTIAASSKSRTPSPSLPLPSSIPTSHTAPSGATNSATLSSLKSKERSPSPLLRNDQFAASMSKKGTSPTPSIYSTASSNHIPVASSPLLKSQDRSSISPSPSVQIPTTRSSLSPSPSVSSMSNHTATASNRITQLSKSRESSISPSPLSRTSISPTPSSTREREAPTSQSVPIKHTQCRDSISPTPSPLTSQNLPQNALDDHKRSVSPASSLLSSVSNSNHTESNVKPKPHDLDTPSPCLPFTAVSLTTLSSHSSSSTSSDGFSVSSLKRQHDMSNDTFVPAAKHIKIGTNGRDSVRNASVSRTPSPQVFSRDKVRVNGQGYVRPVTTPGKTCGSFSTGSTSLTTSTSTMQPARHPIATGVTSLTASNLSAFTPASVQDRISTGNTPAVGHSGRTGLATSITGLTTSTRSAFTPPSAGGNVSALCNSTSVLSNGTRIAASLNFTNSSGFTLSSEESVKVDDVLELLSGPICQWGNCTRYQHANTVYRVFFMGLKFRGCCYSGIIEFAGRIFAKTTSSHRRHVISHYYIYSWFILC